MSASQLALPLRLQDYAVFDSFFASGNATLVAHLKGLAESGHEPGAYLWGSKASGKTHLLQAVCAQAGDESMYVPMRQVRRAGPGILHGLTDRKYVCLDDVDSVAGDDAWELGLFELLNQSADNGGILVVSSAAPPRECGFALADLQSRMSRLPVFHSRELEESDRIRALQLRARHRGLELPDETANYLLGRSRRDMASLYGLLDKLDTEAMIAKRRLTIPFVRKVLQA